MIKCEGRSNRFGRNKWQVSITIAVAIAVVMELGLTVGQASAASSPKTVAIKNVNSGLVLDVIGGSTANGASVIQWPDAGDSNQRWRLKAVAGDSPYVKIVNAYSKKCLDVPGGSALAETKLVQWTCGGGANQRWKITTSGTGSLIINKASGLAIDIYQASTQSGIAIEQYPVNGKANQQFLIGTSRPTKTTTMPAPTASSKTAPTASPNATTSTPAAAATAPTAATSAATPATANGVVQPLGVTGSWNLKFQDEFNGTELDTSRWATLDGWHINDVTTHASNVRVSGGNAYLELASSTSGAALDSAPYDGAGSNGFVLPVGGYAEARVNLPGNGTDIYNWGGFWTSGPNWPSAGENDVVEVLGGEATVNYHSTSGAHNQGAISGYWGGQFHTYGIHRFADHTEVFWDGKRVESYSTDDNGDAQALLLNTGNGGTTNYGSEMIVDYVRAWTP